MTTTFIPTLDLARKLIAEQFPEFSHLPINGIDLARTNIKTFFGFIK